MSNKDFSKETETKSIFSSFFTSAEMKEKAEKEKAEKEKAEKEKAEKDIKNISNNTTKPNSRTSKQKSTENKNNTKIHKEKEEQFPIIVEKEEEEPVLQEKNQTLKSYLKESRCHFLSDIELTDFLNNYYYLRKKKSISQYLNFLIKNDLTNLLNIPTTSSAEEIMVAWESYKQRNDL